MQPAEQHPGLTFGMVIAGLDAREDALVPAPFRFDLARPALPRRHQGRERMPRPGRVRFGDCAPRRMYRLDSVRGLAGVERQ